jgi:hypothetical protein
MLPQLLAFLGPELAASMGMTMSPAMASAAGSALGATIQTGNIGAGITSGMGSYFGGKMYGNLAGKAFGDDFADASKYGQMFGSVLGSSAGLPPEAPKSTTRKSLDGVPTYSDRLSTPLDEELRRRRSRGTVKGFQEGGQPESGIMSLAQPQLNDKDVVALAVKALKGTLPEEVAVRALSDFAAKFGRDALIDLAERVSSGDIDKTAQKSEGMIRGAGDGMEDLVTATLDGKEDILLSDNEYILPADYVSHLGNGSSEAGARMLDRSVEDVRKMRTGTGKQAPPIDGEGIIQQMVS